MTKTAKTDAEAKYAKTQKRAVDAARAMSDAQAEAKRVDENTTRLKALRMAREAAERVAAASAPAKKKAPAKPRAKVVPAKKLNAHNDG